MAAATRQMISDWFRRGVREEKADYMIVVCDSFDYEDYPVYVSTEKFWEKYNEFDGKNMQRIMEVYDLKQDRIAQVEASGMVFNTPPRETRTTGTSTPLIPAKRWVSNVLRRGKRTGPQLQAIVKIANGDQEGLTHYMLRTLRGLGIVKKNSLELTAKGLNYVVRM